ncbi:hypothetical protein F0562_011388 [Nyssa sinensis]|uniref:F-box domain-containing protein n=1 Tax=Nyssa sinensis TaxID=561372 RepID=A0A5J5A4A1_9ASTE|nr:hypothetical protein F0562_011388 [Nyssa sinensis]
MSTDLCQFTVKDLPRDVIVDILSRLPVRSLLRFKCVCKSWYDLLKNPNFCAKHFNQITFHNTTTNSSCFLFTRRQSNANNNYRSVSLLSSNETFDVPINLDIPFLSISKPLRISGTSNGLVCLSVTPVGSIILLWNPATREFKDLPISPISRPQSGPIKVVFGFGFDPNTNDYKVLRIVYYCYPCNQVEVYSLRTNSWREINTPVQFIIMESSCRVFLRGKFHWTALGVGDLNGRELIVSFDMRDEEFRHMTLPDIRHSDDEDFGYGWHLVALKDCLAVIVYPSDAPNKSFDIWVMNEYGVGGSWTKLMSFGPYPGVNKPLGCRNNGEVLLHKDNGELVLFEPGTREFRNVPINGAPYCSEVFIHMESLLPVRGGKVVEETDLNAVVPDLFFVRKIDLMLE